MPKFLQDILNKPYLVLTLLWFVAFCVVSPIGEFPINDDWAYTKNVYNLSINNKFVVDSWPAMNLVSQTLYGTLVCKVFGFSFTALRLSILVLAIVSSLFLYKIILRLSSNQNQLALLFTVGFCFSTLFCVLSFSFMTDIFFLSFVIFAVYQIQLYVHTKHWRNYLFFILFCVIAVLNRQHGVLIPVLIMGAVFYHEKTSIKSILMMAIPIVLTWLAHDKYRHYLTFYGVSHNLQNTDKLWKYLEKAPFEEIHAHAGDLFLTTGWITLPVIVLLVLTQFPKRTAGNLIMLGVCALIAALIVWEDWKYYPQGNVSLPFEIGPRVIKADPLIYYYNNNWWWPKLSRILAYLSATLCLFFITLKFISRGTVKKNATIYIPFLLVAGVYFIFVSLNEAYLDRYSLPLALLVLLLLIPDAGAKINRYKMGIVYALVGITFLTSILETRDYFVWQKTRWEAINYLHKKNISPHHIDGGFEYNGWYATHNSFSQPPKSWWWVDDDTYIVAASKIHGYRVDAVFTAKRILPYTHDTIYVLKRNE